MGALLLSPFYPAPAQTSPATATTAPENIDAELQTQLTEIDRRAGQVKDLTANFVQKKFTALMNKPLVSSGQVRSAGPVIRWDTHAPQASVLYTDGKELRLYYPSQKLEEIYPIDQRLSDLLASPVPRLKAVRDHFQISRADNSVIAELLGPGARPANRSRLRSSSRPSIRRSSSTCAKSSFCSIPGQGLHWRFKPPIPTATPPT